MVEMFISVLSSAVATSHMCLLSTCGVASATEKLNFSFYLVLMSLNLNSHPWLGAAVLDTATLDEQKGFYIIK